MKDYVIRGTAMDNQVRFFAATTKELVEKARIAHGTSPVITAALGRLLTAGSMMGLMCKNDTDLITLLNEYASLLADKGCTAPALTVLETAFAIQTDISASYSLAASIYRAQGQADKIEQLVQQAEKLNSPRKNAIVRMLRTTDPDNG